MPSGEQRTAIIIGAGPAGLTAALELLRTTDIKPVVLEATSEIGGISRTALYRGNRIDIGGHRFFSKSAAVLTWWQEILPLQGAPAADDRRLGRDLGGLLAPGGPDPDRQDRVLLIRSRLSRILHQRKFFNYPLSLGWRTAVDLGFGRLLLIGASYLKARLRPIAEVKSLEDFFINRFGRRLYRTFFKDYTEKVWGVPCDRIPAEWGAQRIKGMSVAGVLRHALRSLVARDHSVAQKNTETSLIKRFLYPKFGPGQLWEEVARRVREQEGEIIQGQQVVGLKSEGRRLTRVVARDQANGREREWEADFVFSSMPVRELIAALDQAPAEVREIAAGLAYRDFITVGLLVRNLRLAKGTGPGPEPGATTIPDNWIYIQEEDVRLGRLQVFNNWSPYLVRDPNTVWLGLEYFCNEGDDLWRMDDQALRRLGAEELARLGFIDPAAVLDGVVIRQPKAYPAYFGAYHRFARIRAYSDSLENLFLIGRNGMHRYNNMDHSMLTAMAAVAAARTGSRDKSAIWAVNSEEEYHEAGAEKDARQA